MSLPKAAHTFIDDIADLFNIQSRELGNVRSYRSSELNDFPSSITSENTPCAVHYITDCQPKYSSGGPTILFWEGQSDFHLTADIKPANYGRVMQYYPLILQAAMSNVQLSNKVAHFVIPEQSGAMRFVTYKNPDGTDSHQGIVVRWTVKQEVSGEYTVST